MRSILTLSLSLFLLIVHNTQGQDVVTANSKRAFWLPDHAKVQFAGSTGMFSAFVGYGLGKTKRHTLEAGYGIKPKEVRGNKDFDILTFRYLYSAIKAKQLNDRWSVRPLEMGLSVLFFFDHTLTDFDDRFPDGYYGLRNDETIQTTFGSSVTRKLNRKKGLRAISAYYNINQDVVYVLDNFRSLNQKRGYLISIGLGLILHFE